MKKMVIVASDKGGTGKTTWARGYADWLRRKASSAYVADADGDVGQLLQFYGTRGEDGRLLKEQDGAKGVGYFSILDARQRDQAVDCIDSGADRILMDMPSGGIKLLYDFNTEVGFFDCARRSGYHITLVDVISPMLASARTVGLMLDAFQDEADLSMLVVKNRFFGSENDDWERFDSSKTRTRLEDRKGLIINMPPMRMRTYVMIDELNLQFTAATQDSRLRTVDKSVAFRWMALFDAEIERAEGVL